MAKERLRLLTLKNLHDVRNFVGPKGEEKEASVYLSRSPLCLARSAAERGEEEAVKKRSRKTKETYVFSRIKAWI